MQAPLFPRYIFLILDLGRDRWLSVRGTVGVSSLFTSEDRPVPVPESIVETLIQNSDEANLALFSSGLTTGQSVRILSGPFANFVGQLERLDAAGRWPRRSRWRFVAAVACKLRNRNFGKDGGAKSQPSGQPTTKPSST